MTTTTTTVSQAETLANRILDILEQQGVAVWGCYSEPDAAACRRRSRPGQHRGVEREVPPRLR